MIVQKFNYCLVKAFNLLETFTEYHVTFECVLCGIYITAFVIPTIIKFFGMSYIEHNFSLTLVFKKFRMFAILLFKM